MSDTRHGVTTVLKQIRAGDAAAVDRLVSLLYGDLRRLAAYHLRRERANHTLQPTALVNEVYVKVFGSDTIEWQDRAHFFAVVSRNMRRILVEHARRSKADKRGGTKVRVAVDDLDTLGRERDEDLVALDDALQTLERNDARASRIVELRFFTGLTEHEIGEVLGVSVATVKRDWTFARAWLLRELDATRARS